MEDDDLELDLGSLKPLAEEPDEELDFEDQDDDFEDLD